MRIPSICYYTKFERGLVPFRKGIQGWVVYMGYYWILVAPFIPITLYVTIAIVKNYQAFFMEHDCEMYDEDTDTPAQVRNSDLNDELGQITQFSVIKLECLTANVMNFRKMSINGVSEIGREAFLHAGKALRRAICWRTIRPLKPALRTFSLLIQRTLSCTTAIRRKIEFRLR